MLQPDLHITIHVTEEAIRLLCGTVGFIAMCWVAVKAIQILPKKEPHESPSNPC
jgi:hypothetical protein